ncbi:leucine-rich repeat extensin-like protein 3 [Schistocerca piceifrons]|uniref:leucine-rich repeat extensin-like protein 3 n=1 Tax=Schistocerca piceifrons TaxID=274613 RepID=UPI001F5ECD34|nr:leucine-rich repeat extensin-like protein 3 [Schistocerca piceifrons]
MTTGQAERCNMKLLVAVTLCCSLLAPFAQADDAPTAKPKRSLYDLGLGPYFGPAPPPLSYAVPAPAAIGPPPPAFVAPAPAPVVTKVVAPLPLPAPVFTKVVAPLPLAPAPVVTKVVAPLPPPVVTRVTYPLPPVVTKVSYPVPSLLAKLAYHAAPPLPFPLPPSPLTYAAYAPHFAKVAAPLPYW